MTGGSGRTAASLAVLLWLPLLFSCVSCIEAAREVPNDHPSITAKSSDLWPQLRDTTSLNASMQLFARSLPAGQCSATEPCVDSSCCANTGYCGLDPAHCGSSVCISNCDAKAECGIGAATPGAQCPLNVCCSQYGYCGTTSDFCGTGCQSNCDQPNPIQLSPPGNIQNIVIGYWEAWSLTTRSCAARTLNDVRTDSITHLNVAFGYITPGTFQIYAIPGADATILGSLANLKQNAPGLKVGHRWLSLGGWSFSDNDTTTQPVFSNIASTAVNRAIFITNLVQFMKEWDFDGVDIDWEYPGAPDRGGQPNDGQNYVYLVRDIQTVFNDLPYDWGLSFTAPTSYWYMRWFEIGDMMQYVNWVNLMTYDLHGSWDSPEDSIGSFVYAHTNLTEIEEALDLLWRNDVPANQVNLGLGFYGRTYTLSDPSCSAPGCPFSGPGVAGECTGTPGVLSYDEITTYRKMYNPNTVYDQVAAVNYFQYSADQWVSYDDVVSIRAKVSWANNYGLLGLFIWALDLDDSSYSALNSVLAPDGLGKFKSQNGVGSGLTSNWISIVGDQCYFAGCGETCPPITVQTGEPVYCGPEKTQPLCCPINNAPDPAFCQWRAGSVDFVCYDNCRSDEVLIAQSSWPIVNGEPKFCLAGQGDYCCALEESGPQLCGWSDTCVSIDPHSGIPTATGACPAGRNFVTYGKQNCDINSNSWAAFCCDAEVNTKSCSWGGADPYDCSSSCGPNQVEVAEDMQGGGAVCGSIDPDTAVVTYPESLCCNAAALRFSTVNLPVPLDYLFPSPGPSTDTQKIDLEIDQTPYGTSSQDPNENAFGFMIVSGPASDVANLNKREGSHWELYDCPSEHHEEQQTAKAICINDGPESTCGDLWLGGIPGKVMEMPPGCGPGKYAIAVSFEPAENQDQNNQQIPRHIRRGLAGKTIYDFTFDYDWKRAQKRVSSSTLLRIDYSDDKGYWDSVIASPATLRQKRDLEVEQEHGGDYKRWLEHTWRTERRSMNRDELHARWFSADIVQWFDRQGAVSLDVVGLHHRVQTTYTWWLFDFQRSCSVYDVAISSRFRMWADLNIDVSASIGVTLIGHLADLHSWDESHVWFRSMGSVDTVLHFDAYAQLSFETGQVELFGLENFGANFRIPGLVTIGPNIQVVGSLAGQASIHASAQVEMKIADWDITQRYPSADTPSLENRPVSNALPVDGYGQQTPDISWDISADGEIVAHVIPKVVLGIVWDTDFLGDCSIELGVDNSMRLTGYASISSTEDPKWCYSADGAAQIYAQVNAPNMFGANYQFYWTLNTYPYQLIYPVCNVPEEPPSPN